MAPAMTPARPSLPQRAQTGRGAEVNQKYGADWFIWADSNGQPVATRRKHLRLPLADGDKREQTVMADDWDDLERRLAAQRSLDEAAGA
jgi:hypothetical protein